MPKIIIPGGAGLVGQNLIVRLKNKGYDNIVVIDKHKTNLNILKSLHQDVTIVNADLSCNGAWEEYFTNADIVIMLQAQIGGNSYQQFLTNNINSTKLILQAIHKNQIPYCVHISSSVVNSVADDFYTKTKIKQEEMVIDFIKNNNIDCPILRPTLMYGWFDRKHLGWLARFMQKTPVFPIVGKGNYIRQPLYVGDFCNIIISCIENKISNGIYNISGQEQVYYIDIIRQIKKTTKAKSLLIKTPYWLFYFLIWLWGWFDKNPPFTTQQLSALVAGDKFEIINWPKIFGVQATPFDKGIDETFNNIKYSNIVLEF